jgi:hypothetical protein
MERKLLVAIVLVGLWLGLAGPVLAIEDRTGESAPAPARPVGGSRIEAPVFRLEVPFRTQKDGGRWQVSNCGPAALGMVLDGFGLRGQATDDLRFRSHTYQGTVGMRTGTALEHVARVAEDFGVPTFGLFLEDGSFRRWTSDDLRTQLRQGRPVMALVRLYLLPGYEWIGPRWGHYVLLTGTDRDGFFYSDSLRTDPVEGTGGYIAVEALERAMLASHIPGQAVAFGGAGLAPLAVWLP